MTNVIVEVQSMRLENRRWGWQLTVYLIQGNVLKKGDIGARLMCLKKDCLAKGNNTGKNI